MRYLTMILLTVVAAVLACHPGSGNGSSERSMTPPRCEWCGAPEAPSNLSWRAVIAGGEESGQRLVIEGIIYGRDRITPALNVLVYAYQTNSSGIYPKRGGETGNGIRHGYLRGWLRTGTNGRYRIETIRPGSYPTGSEPAHIHMTIQAPGEAERYVDDIIFADDPRVTEAYRSRLQNRGGSGIVHVARHSSSVMHATRDIYLD